jgi:hypothetical protein
MGISIKLNSYVINVGYKVHTWLLIYKCKDEWYYITNLLSTRKQYYKCDQIEGVLQYIRDEIKGKKYHDIMQ